MASEADSTTPNPLTTGKARSDSFDTPKQQPVRRHFVKHILIGVAVLAALGAIFGVAYTLTKKMTVQVPQHLSGSFVMKSTGDTKEFVYRGRVMKKGDGDDTVVEFISRWTDPYSGYDHVVSANTDGAYWQVFNGATLIRSECAPERLYMPMQDVNAVLDRGQSVPADVDLNVESADIDVCVAQGGQKHSMRWGALKFAYCSPSLGVHIVSSAEWSATVTQDNVAASSLNLETPLNMTTNEPLSCTVPSVSSLLDMAVPPPETELPAGSRRLKVSPDDFHVTVTKGEGYTTTRYEWKELPQPLVEHRRKLREAEEAELAQGRRLGEKRQLHKKDLDQCVFVKGVVAGNAAETYWGNTGSGSSIAQLCPAVVIVSMDTFNQAWDSSTLANAYCDAARASGDIKNTITVCHGTGCLVVAYALREDYCRRDGHNEWISLAAPWNGEKLANSAWNLCNNNWGSASNTLKELGFCRVSGSTFQGISTGAAAAKMTYSPNVAFSTLKSWADGEMTGESCGRDPIGMNTGAGTMLSSLADQTSITANTNDGAVHRASCQSDTPETQYWKDNYLVNANYFDLSGRYGNPAFDGDGSSSPLAFIIANLNRYQRL